MKQERQDSDWKWLVSLLVSGLMVSTSVQASGYCSYKNASEGISVSDVTFNGIRASDCYGVQPGNITGGGAYAGESLLNSLAWGTGWTYADGTDESQMSYQGLSITVSATGLSSGSWTLRATDINGGSKFNLPASLDLVVGLKASTEYALWGFNDVKLDGNDAGEFRIVFDNNGSQNPGVSHLIVFVREASAGVVREIDD